MRAKISSLIAEFRKIPKFDIQVCKDVIVLEFTRLSYIHYIYIILLCQVVVNEILRLVQQETSHKVCAEHILSLTKLGSQLAHDNPLHNKVISAARQVFYYRNYILDTSGDTLF